MRRRRVVQKSFERRRGTRGKKKLEITLQGGKARFCRRERDPEIEKSGYKEILEDWGRDMGKERKMFFMS